MASPGCSPRPLLAKFGRRGATKDANNNNSHNGAPALSHAEPYSYSGGSSRSSSGDRDAQPKDDDQHGDYQHDEEDYYDVDDKLLDGDNDDDRCSSTGSYGPTDTKTPYIMRLIEAKSGNGVARRTLHAPSTEVTRRFAYKSFYLTANSFRWSN